MLPAHEEKHEFIFDNITEFGNSQIVEFEPDTTNQKEFRIEKVIY